MYENDFGIEAEFIDPNLLLFKASSATRTNNIIFHIALNQLSALPSGEIEFLDKSFIARGTKSYFKEGGAFGMIQLEIIMGKSLSF